MDYNPPVGGAPGDPYVDANPGSGIEGSPVPAASIEYPQREIVAAILAAGLTPDNSELKQLASAIQLGTLGVAVAGGTADAITAVFDPPITALIDGMAVCVRAGAANATTTPTFTPAAGTIAPKTIVKGAGAALVASDIAGAGHWIVLRYDQSLDKWALQNPAASVSIASTAEAQAQINNTNALTPLRLGEALQGGNHSLVGTGYQRLPGGLILQWGSLSIAGNGSPVVTFPIAFNNCFSAGPFASGISNLSGSATTKAISFNSTTLSLQNAEDVAVVASWLAIGN